jgi:aminoglycoside phosphotransferase (APT) family kinase protein
MYGWIVIPGTALAGAVFEWIDGTIPAAVAGAVRDAATAIVRRLHADATLAAELRRLGDVERTCADGYRGSYHERFVEDLRGIRCEPPSFVDPPLLAWLAEEADRIAGLVDASTAFAAPAASATHRDLWLDNLMVTGDGRLYILDWDEIGLGDPMMDWAMLLGPSRARVVPATAADLDAVGGASFTRAERERFDLYARASLLDWTIDPLSDWVEAAREPLHGETVRAVNRRTHTRALALYRELYG